MSNVTLTNILHSDIMAVNWNLFLTYEAKVAALVTVFYVFYKLLLDRVTLHRLNRIVLLASCLLALLLPFCVITLHKDVLIDLSAVTAGNADTSGATAVTNQDATHDVWSCFLGQSILGTIIMAGIVFCLTRTLFGIRRIHTLLENSETITLNDGIRVAVTDADITPFSWMNTIVVGRDDYNKYSENSKERQMVFSHELGHILGRHSLDVLFMEVLTALQWFNPVQWLLRRELRAVHEYEADANVLSKGCDISLYVKMLMHKAMGTKAYALVNGINDSMIKKRITRMIMKKSAKVKDLRALYIIPIVAASVAVTAKTVINYKYVNTPNSELTVVEKAKSDSVFIGPSGQRRIPIYGQREDINAQDRLIVIDGKISSYEDLQQLVTSQREKIESMTLLGEESGQKIYGAKGAKGVLMVNLVKERPTDDDRIFDTCEKMPEFSGGVSALYEFIAKNVRYPQIALENAAQGRVIVQFVVEKDGKLSNVHALSVGEYSVNNLNEVVVNSYKSEMTDEERADVSAKLAAHQALVDEALRVVKAMPQWEPGTQQGRSVRVKFTMPVSFRLQ